MNKFNGVNQRQLQPVISNQIYSNSNRIISSITFDETKQQVYGLSNLSNLDLVKSKNYIINLQLSFISNSTNIKYIQMGVSNKTNDKLFFETENNIAFDKLTKNLNVLLTSDDDYYIFVNSTSQIQIDFKNSYCNILQL